MRVVVASRNPVKLEATRRGFRLAFGREPLALHALDVPSGVADQPMSDEETQRGAHKRVTAARRHMPEADYWVGIEGGVREVGLLMEAFAWVVVADARRRGCARSAAFPLPLPVAQALRRGEELGQVMDTLFGESQSKHKGGAIGLLSRGAISRTELYVQPVVMACLPFLHPHWYPEGG